MGAKIWAVIFNCMVLAIGPALKGLQEPAGCQLERRRRKRDARLAQGRLPASWSNGAGDCKAPCTVPLPHVAWLEVTLPSDLIDCGLVSSCNSLRKQGLVFEPVPFVL